MAATVEKRNPSSKNVKYFPRNELRENRDTPEVALTAISTTESLLKRVKQPKKKIYIERGKVRGKGVRKGCKLKLGREKKKRE